MEWMLDIQLGRRNLSPIQRMPLLKSIDQFMRNRQERINQKQDKIME